MKILLATNQRLLTETVQKSLRRFHYDWTVVQNGSDAFQKLLIQTFDLAILSYDLEKMTAVEVLKRIRSASHPKVTPVMVLVQNEAQRVQIENEYFSQVEAVSIPFNPRRFVDVINRSLHQGLQMACLGGGTGLYTLLSGLKTLSGVRLTSIVSMSDDGGSTGRLRDQFGVLPPGDIRRSIVALSTAPELLNELIQYRFEKGEELKGHNLGNLILTALSEIHGSMTTAIRILSELLDIQGKVVPVTDSGSTLKAKLENGSIIVGEHRIDLFENYDPGLLIEDVWLDPKPMANPNAIEAILNADWVILGPGDLYTSVIPNLLVEGITDALQASHAKKIYVCNLMTEVGETTDFQVSDHVRNLIRYLGKDILDFVLCSNTTFSPEALEMYHRKSQKLVQEKEPSKLGKITGAKIIWADVASEHLLVRHDSLKLAVEVQKIIAEHNP